MTPKDFPGAFKDLSGFPKNSRVDKYHICRVGVAFEGLIRTLLAGLTGEDLT